MDIKNVIRQRGWTIERLAKEMTVVKGKNKGQKGISQSALSQLLVDYKKMDYQRLEEIANIIGVSVAELVSEENPTPKVICPKCGYVINLKAE